MNDKTIELINRLADKLGTTADHLWGVLVKQARIEGYFECGKALLAIVIMAVFFTFARRFVSRLKEDSYADWSAEMMVWFIVILFMAVGLGVFGASFRNALACFGNPEYWALKQLLH